MPIYEYRCTQCGHRFDVTHPVGQTVERCEKCKGPVRRVFSPVGVIFKGSGFHVNDYRKAPAASEGDGKPAAKETGTSTDKPAASKEKSGDSKATSSGTSGGSTPS
jgi:putative FmdB family regulatory protein